MTRATRKEISEAGVRDTEIVTQLGIDALNGIIIIHESHVPHISGLGVVLSVRAPIGWAATQYPISFQSPMSFQP